MYMDFKVMAIIWGMQSDYIKYRKSRVGKLFDEDVENRFY